MTWSAPVLVIDPEGDVRAFDPCLWVDPDGRLWLFWAQAYGHWDGRAGVWAMVADEPDRQEPGWSSPRRLWDGIMMNKPLELSSGEWALPVAIWSLTPTISGPQVRDLADRSGSLMVVSTDRGTNWGLRGKSAVPQRSCDEHHIVELKDGRLWMLVRTEYGIGDSYSSDRGRTWDPGGQSHITHIPHARFFIRRLASGRLLLVKHDPPDRNTRSHLTAFLSEDEGQTWQGGLLLDKRRGVSYPDGVQGPDGTIYVIYDYSRRSEKKILLTTFSESDVLMGAYRSPVARQRLLVNQATGR
jgi:hypothetical protein